MIDPKDFDYVEDLKHLEVLKHHKEELENELCSLEDCRMTVQWELEGVLEEMEELRNKHSL